MRSKQDCTASCRRTLEYNEEPEGEVLTFSEKVKTYVDGVIDNQKYMFSYHSGLNSTHPYQSAWYEWPLGNRPVWFYSGGQNPDTTKFGTISTFGNPAVWWICFAGTLTLFIMFLRNRFRLNAEIFFIFACMASSMLPLDADFPLRVRISLLCDRADDNTCLCICAQAL